MAIDLPKIEAHPDEKMEAIESLHKSIKRVERAKRRLAKQRREYWTALLHAYQRVSMGVLREELGVTRQRIHQLIELAQKEEEQE